MAPGTRSRRAAGLGAAAGMFALCVGACGASPGTPAWVGPTAADGARLPRLTAHSAEDPSLPWVLTAAVNAASGKLEIRVGAGGCALPAGWDAVWTGTSVTFAVYGTQVQPGVQACAAVATVRSYEVDLPQRLGDRHLVHLASSPDFSPRLLRDLPSPVGSSGS
ncbi:hypothetical protein KDL01_18950 [Actinospica durhamensis]|uniref:Secreted protein n=1 Tax=Actinospica durhamensis TaxID=1508375 RepID=A0A941EQ88_9ACTN|nr:hypothetical protein [Actinospica durhamensis]MBR7835360.1 hypothetical protein [Actinospica durhamensis]